MWAEKGVLWKVASQGDLIINPYLDRSGWVVMPHACNVLGVCLFAFTLFLLLTLL